MLKLKSSLTPAMIASNTPLVMIKKAFILAAVTPSLYAEVEEAIPLGLEAVTGYRSEYVYRGAEVSQDVIEFQISGEVSLSNNTFLGIGAWHATGSGDADFSDSGVKLSLTHELGAWQYKGTVAYHDYQDTFLESGVVIDNQLSFFFGESVKTSNKITGIVSFDTGADGFYGALEYGSHYALNDDSFFSFKLGVSALSDYYSLNGLNDAYSRLSYTYNLTKQVSVSPYIGASIQLDDAFEQDSLHGGLWFEVSF